jgi:hypothetical protein
MPNCKLSCFGFRQIYIANSQPADFQPNLAKMLSYLSFPVLLPERPRTAEDVTYPGRSIVRFSGSCCWR